MCHLKLWYREEGSTERNGRVFHLPYYLDLPTFIRQRSFPYSSVHLTPIPDHIRNVISKYDNVILGDGHGDSHFPSAAGQASR